MLPVMVSLVPLMVLSAGSGPCHHREVRKECSRCDDDGVLVARQTARLHSAGWIGRRKAARGLGGFDWKDHPEAAEALADVLIHDDCKLVRQEAAETLARMRPCLPAVHEAVARAARSDDSLLVRHWGKKALKALTKSCVEPCRLCDEGGETIVPGRDRVYGEEIVPLPPASPSPFEGREAPDVPSVEPLPSPEPPLIPRS